MKLPAVPSEGLLKALPPEERAKLGRAGMIREVAQARFEAGQEKKLQGIIASWLHSHKHYYVRPRMDKKTTTPRGTPDFIVCVKEPSGNGRFLAIEAKTRAGSLSVDQLSVMAEACRSGATYCVARSLDDVIAVLETIHSS